MPLPIGTAVGPYEIVGWIGAGGMGDVYRARDPRLGRDVAIKLIAERFAADRSRLHRFELEARAAGQLSHPNIVAVYDIGTHAGMPFIVSELLEGESLAIRLRRGALAPRRVMEYASQVAAALGTTHEKGLIHRDLKPDNLFITHEGRVKILDFGIAKLTTPVEEVDRPTGFPTETAEGFIVGTTGYMSPEQVLGETVDARTDIFSFGAVLYEMLTGHPVFVRATRAETIAAILKEEPADLASAGVPPALARLVSRCLEKAREARFQSARDLAFALDSLLTGSSLSTSRAFRRWRLDFRRLTLPVALALLAGSATAYLWFGAAAGVPVDPNPLADALPSLLTDWEGAEEGAEISPDGKLVAFLSDRLGEWDIWLTQIGSGHFTNLTRDVPPLAAAGSVVRKLGFTGDGSEIWFNPADGKALMLMPWSAGPARPLLEEGANTPAWAPDGNRLVYVFKANRDDPIFLVDRIGADPRLVLEPGPLKNLNPVWSPDGEWIYFVRGAEPQDESRMDIWRVRPAGGPAEQMSDQPLAINFLASVDPGTLLHVARDRDGSGPWLWAFDVHARRSRRMPTGVDQFTSVSASRDGRRIVATVSNPSASLWRLPLRDRLVEEQETEPYALPVPTGRALAPRFSRQALFYLSARGTRDGLWKVQQGESTEVWRDAEGALSEPPAVSPDGQQLAVVARRDGRRTLSIMAADGTRIRALAPSIEVAGAAGQSAIDWSPDGTRIVAGGRDGRGPALFVIPIDGGPVVRLREGSWTNPQWSPTDTLIVYAGQSVVGQVQLLGIRPDGTPVEIAPVMVRPGGYRFLPDGRRIVFIPRIQALDFWIFDIAGGATRQLSSLANRGALRTFDITPDGRSIVFDRSRQNSNIALFDLTNADANARNPASR
jgi:Tol biopolymer transport system component